MTQTSGDKEKDSNYRRKRINRLKKIIIGTIVGWMAISLVAISVLIYHNVSLNSSIESLNKKLITSSKETAKLYDNLNSKIEDESAEISIEDESDISLSYASLSGNEPDEITAKQVYLTFDDGPSDNTGAILDVLKEYGVKATFFVVGKTDDYSLGMYKRIVDEGHTIGLHSYTHRYNQIYDSVDSFNSDIEKLSKLIQSTTGVKPNFMRFPGGSSNQVSNVNMKELATYMTEQGYIYFDWNVVSGDASSKAYTAEYLRDNVLNGIDNYQTSVVLFHDASSKDSTVEALRMVLEQLKDENVEILPIDMNTKVIQHVHAESANNN